MPHTEGVKFLYLPIKIKKMNRVDRLMGITTVLQSKKFATAEFIAEKFDISVRTVYRDIKALAEVGVPVSFEPNKGYFVVHGYFLPPISLTSEEANALLLMESLVQLVSDKSIKTHYSNALNKVKTVMRPSDKEKLEQLNKNILYQLPPCFTPDYEYLSIVQKAISAKNILAMEYQNKKEEVSSRRVEPIGLIFYAFSWHLVAWCHKREDYRDFKISRILTVKNTEMPFKKTEHIELKDYMSELPAPY